MAGTGWDGTGGKWLGREKIGWDEMGREEMTGGEWLGRDGTGGKWLGREEIGWDGRAPTANPLTTPDRLDQPPVFQMHHIRALANLDHRQRHLLYLCMY
jgi:hypothetical protein